MRWLYRSDEDLDEDGHLDVAEDLDGNGVITYNLPSRADNLPATDAMLSGPQGVALDADGNLYIADTDNHVIRVVWR